MISISKLNDKTQYIFHQLNTKGVDEAALSISLHKGFSVSFREGMMDTLEYDDAQNLSLTIFSNKKSARISITHLSLESLNQAIKKVLSLVKYVEPDQYSGLPEPQSLAVNDLDLSLDHPSSISPKDLANQMTSLAHLSDKNATSNIKISTESVQLSAHRGFIWQANTINAFQAHYPYSRYSLSCQIVAKKNTAMQMDYDYMAARSVNNLAPLSDFVEQTITRTIKRLDARSAISGRFPIIFEARVATTLWRHLLSAIEGMAIYRQMSFLQNAVGKTIFPNFVTIKQKPHIIQGLHSAPFDSEGVLTRSLKYVDQGRLINYVLNSYTARCLGLHTTGNAGGLYNVEVSSQGDTLEALCRQMNKGYFITELLGQGVNLVTGDYSRGAFGYWVDNGKIQYPVQGLTIAGNLKKMFQHILSIGNDLTKYSNISTGSVLIDEMMVSAS